MTDERNPVTGKPKSKRGFASMTPERQREIRSMGGKAVKAEDRHFAQDPDSQRRASKLGLEALAKKNQE